MVALLVRIFIKGYLRWFVISALLLLAVLAVKLVFFDRFGTFSVEAYFHEITSVLLLFPLLCGLADLFKYWMKCLKERENTT